MNFPDSIKTCLTKYVDFQGRASRSEYWWFILFSFLLQFVGAMINQNLATVVALALLLPTLAALARRLHDIDRTAWWILIGVIPLIGSIILIIFAVTPSTPGPNRFGV